MLTVKISAKRPILPTRAQILEEEVKKLEADLGKCRRTMNYMSRNREQKYAGEQYNKVYEEMIRIDGNLAKIRNFQAKNFMELEADKRQEIRRSLREKQKVLSIVMVSKVLNVDGLVQDEEEARECLIQIYEFELKLIVEANEDEDREAERRLERVKMTDLHKVEEIETFERVARDDILFGERTDFANLIRSF